MLMENLRSVRVLAAEVEAEGSFSAAARSLGLSQSAVSQHVAALEARVGATLVERRTRPVVLTEPGHAVVRADATLARLESHGTGAGGDRRAARGRLRCRGFDRTDDLRPGGAGRFRRERPATSLTVVDDHLQRLLPRLDDGELDLAIVWRAPGATDTRTTRDLGGSRCWSTSSSWVLPSGHALARARSRTSPLSPRHLGRWHARKRLVPDRPGGSCRAVWASRRRVGFASDDFSAVVAFVAAGLEGGARARPRCRAPAPRSPVRVGPVPPRVG